VDRWEDDLELCRTLARQAYPDDAVDALARGARRAGLDDLAIDLDARGNATVERPYDPVFIERLRALTGVTRDKAAGHWRVPPRSLPGLADLVEALAGPTCSVLGCALGGEAPPSAPHRDAHVACCEGG